MPDAGKAIGPYQLLGLLGAGGMGEVYKALDTRVGRHVALKLLPESPAGDAGGALGARRRFEQEARLAASLNHPNIVAIFDFGLNQHPPYIVTEFVPGESLRALVAKGAVAPRKAVDIAAQIAAGLAAAHASGIIHRDLKPENVMLTPDGAVKILDFGVARMQAKAAAATETVTLAHTAVGSVVGTAAYMSPEQARMRELDHRSDQFSLGLVLYEMLSGKKAFERPSAVQTMSAIVEDEAAPLERPVPAQLRWILERCLAKERESRYESTRDLARELAQLRDHFGELTTSASGEQAALAPPRRRPRTAPLAACALAGALLAWCAAALLRAPGAVDLSRYRLTPFATALATQSYPAWSPDGNSIAFVSLDSGHGQLWVQALRAPTAVAVTGPSVDVNNRAPLFWSPDSASLYFTGAIGQHTGLCRVAAGGGDATMVQPGAARGAISPDGRTLVTLAPSDDGKSWHLWIATPPEAPRKLYEPEPLQLADFSNRPVLAFAPDGAKILLAIHPDREETCWLLPWPPGKARRVFEKNMPFVFTPQFSWMPDSRHVVFSAATQGTYSNLYMADTESGRYWPLMAQDRPTWVPTVSPDGSRVAYQSSLSHTDVIAVPLGDGPVQTLLGSSRSEQMAACSPTAQQVVYVTDRRGAPEVWITSLAEHWDRLLLSLGDLRVRDKPAQFFMTPVFSADGRRVAVVAGPGTAIYTVFASGGSAVRATTETVSTEMSPTWSPDGNWLAFCHSAGGGSRLAKVRPGAGEPPVDLGACGGFLPEWSPTGEWIAAGDPSGGLTLVSPDGKSRRTLSGGGPVAWARDGKTIYQLRSESHSLVAIDVVTGKERTLRDLGELMPFSTLSPGLRASLTPDGKSIVYTVNRPREEIWILDGLQTPRPWYARLVGR